MNLSLTLRDYMIQQRKRCNEPVTMARLMAPFGFAADESASDFLLVGHILDDLAETRAPSERINFVDVCESALDLGHDQAQDFLNGAPLMLTQLKKLTCTREQIFF